MAAIARMEVEGSRGRRRAVLYRMVLPDHVCPYGLKTLSLLRRRGYEVEDHALRTREEVDAFKTQHGVPTTPQTFIDGERVGGYDDLKRRFGLDVHAKGGATYSPVLTLLAVAALMALAASWAMLGSLVTVKSVEWFVASAMCLFGAQKLRDLSAFSSSFLNYDLLAQRWVPYAYIYPFVETGAGVLMIAGAGTLLAAAGSLFIGVVGAVSVFKAVYLDRRTLKCACVGGDSTVPLGPVSLSENLAMIAMALWMGAHALA